MGPRKCISGIGQWGDRSMPFSQAYVHHVIDKASNEFDVGFLLSKDAAYARGAAWARACVLLPRYCLFDRC